MRKPVRHMRCPRALREPLIALWTGLFAHQAFPQTASSVLIRGGEVIDGTAGPPRRLEIRIREDRIAEVGVGLTPRRGERLIDASGKVVVPGFIDIHSHADRGIEEMPEVESQVRQGITTAVVGVDGRSQLPVAEFYWLIERVHPTINFTTMVGHGTIRGAVLGEDFKRPATRREIEMMQELVDRGMRDGAVGLSSGLEYDPGFHAKPGEVAALATVVRRYGGWYASHVRDEENEVLDSWRKAIDVGRAVGLPVHISHMKLASRAVWGKARQALKLLEDAKRAGVRVTGDWYPYAYWQSSLYVLIPDRDWGNRKKWELGLHDIGGAQNVLITSYPPDSSFHGKTLADLAGARRTDPASIIQEMLRAAGPRVGIIGTAMDESDLETLVAHPQVVISSDGSLTGRHPRGYGTFPRVLAHYVRSKGVLTLSEAIAKMTSRSAGIVGLTDRGRIAAGLKADIVVVDPATVADLATMTDPARAPVGIQSVIVNGEIVLDGGKMTGARPGRPLRRQSQAAIPQ